MIRKPNGPDAKRLAAGVVAVALASVGAVALASPASAATTDPATITVSPQNQAGVSGACTTYKVTEVDQNGSPAATGTFTPQVNFTTPSQTAAGGSTTTAANTCNPVNPPAATTGVFYIGLTANNTTTTPTTVPFTVSNASKTISSSADSYVVYDTTNDSVSKLTVSPSSANTPANTAVTFQATAVDQFGNPVAGATVVFSGTNGAASGSNQACGTTTTSGVATCSIQPNAANDSLVFYVNQSGGTANAETTEPQAPATITIVSRPVVNGQTLTCTNQATAAQNANTCTAPAGGTASLNDFVYTVDNNGNQTGVQGAVVTYSTTGGKLSATNVTTNASGNAPVTLTAANSSSTGETDTVTAKVTSADGTTYTATETVVFAVRAATSFTVAPGNTAATTGSTITENVTVVDQFGTAFQPTTGTQTAVLTVTAGRNVGTSATQNTAAGKATLSYTDKGTNATATSDTVTVTVTSNGAAVNGSSTQTQPFTVTYVSSVTPATVGLNYVPANQAGANPACVTDTTDPQDETTDSANSNDDTPTEVCVVLKNSAGQTLAGQSVTFTVSKGKVGNSGVITSSTATTTYTTTSSSLGVAIAYITSQTTGAQTITATSNGVTSNTLTDTYTNGFPSYTVTSSPATTTIAAGSSQVFTVTAVDRNGSPVSGDTINIAKTGPGVLSNTTVFTSSAGTATVSLSTQSTDTGTGSLTFNDANCSRFGQAGATCSATSTYSLTAQSVATVSSVSVSVTGGATIGSSATATATLTGSDGKPYGGGTVNFAVSGATTASGTAVSNSNGVATFQFTTQAAGKFTVTATSATNATATGAASGTTGSTSATRETTTIKTIFSPRKGTIQITANVGPVTNGQTVHFVAVVNGRPVYKTMGVSGPAGNVTTRINNLVSGRVYTFSARVVAPAPAGTYAANRSFRVK